ncbi:GvpL/GvpF family gas vesicle protein [Nocardioides guangzhouensis]|uniref:GvpL/GvpF family gas vesicle protein n=1 Tax=Nocardioides guangzhouensis TaxID=2497878 RepID=A0A4Q4Z999_9ACTN|nr:GvpL/GvpF family gas vesicle protein [Nocardioides guangzhouensis]RYP83634.1 GvpL/GvpF family gas vesicle protein [Nocardioides guangzhouensis]
MSGGLYLFAVSRGLPEGALSAVTGFDGEHLRLVRSGDLQAVVCAVDLAEFGEAALPRNLEDLRWVEHVARTHDEVVRAVARHAEAAPMRLVTIYADEDGVRRQLDRVHDDLVAALDRVTGRSEWGVKVYARPGEPPAAPAPREASGAAYLQRKREAAQARRTADEQVEHVARALHEALSGATVAARVLAPQDPRLSGRHERMIHNGAYLVPEERADEFQATATLLGSSRPDLIVELQGPWPPYSFAVLETG